MPIKSDANLKKTKMKIIENKDLIHDIITYCREQIQSHVSQHSLYLEDKYSRDNG